jgi:hypothetical protein
MNTSQQDDTKIVMEECLPWCTDVDNLMRKWCADCSERSLLHAARASTKKRFFRILSIPTIIIPIAMASFSQLYSACNNDDAKLVNSLGYLVSGSLAGVIAFLNLGNQYAQHAQYEILYYELSTEIECILAKPMAFRTHAEVVLINTRLKYDALNKGSPDL